jgi:hypothetical protein
MEYGSVWERIVVAVVIVAVLVFFTLIRPRNPKKEQADIVSTLLEETNLNVILVGTFEQQQQQWPFHTTCWRLRKKKTGFLDKELQKDIDTAFSIAHDFNQRLRAEVKAKSKKRVTVDLACLNEYFPRIKKGLEDWLLANIGSTDQKTKKPGMTDLLFGGR